MSADVPCTHGVMNMVRTLGGGSDCFVIRGTGRLYAALAERPPGRAADHQLNGTRLGHPAATATGVDDTGSLGRYLPPRHSPMEINGTLYTYTAGRRAEDRCRRKALPPCWLSHLIAFLDCHQQLDGYQGYLRFGDMPEIQDWLVRLRWTGMTSTPSVPSPVSAGEAHYDRPPGKERAASSWRIKYNHHMRFQQEQCEEAIAR